MMADYHTINSTLTTFVNLSSTTAIPAGYDKQYPAQSVAQTDFVPNEYYILLYTLANTPTGYESLQTRAQILVNRPYSPLYCDSYMLDTLKTAVGITFDTSSLTEAQLRSVLYAKLLANINSGTINETMTVFSTFMNPDILSGDLIHVDRYRLGIGTIDIAYTALGGTPPCSRDDIEFFWDGAATGGIYIELRNAPYYVNEQNPDLNYTYFGMANGNVLVDTDLGAGFSNGNDIFSDTGGFQCSFIPDYIGGGFQTTAIAGF